MATRQSYLPTKDSELATWSENFVRQVEDNAAAWDIPSAEVADLRTAVSDYLNLYSQTDSPSRTSITVAEKNAARSILILRIRGMTDFRLRNPIITSAQRIALGLKVRDTIITPIPIPVSRPEMYIEVLDVRRLSVIFRDQGSSTKAKPYGVNGAVVHFDVRDTAPHEPEELTRSVLATRTPYTLKFTEAERGKTVYIALCWQNEKGAKGPYSEIESAIIP
jgi:hypothetical protein